LSAASGKTSCARTGVAPNPRTTSTSPAQRQEDSASFLHRILCSPKKMNSRVRLLISIIFLANGLRKKFDYSRIFFDGWKNQPRARVRLKVADVIVI
jgi:hypothetical protein